MVYYQLPSVQLIGAQKSGTSAIADWLFDEGGFCRPKVFENEPFYYSKEVHFFDLDTRYNQGLDFYAQRFPQQEENDGGSKMKKGDSCRRYLDATPDTLVFPERVRSIYEAAGGNQVNTVKFVAILREPVSRELSLYNHLAYDCRRLNTSNPNDWHNQVLKDDDSSNIMSFDEFVQAKSITALKRSNDDGGPGRSTRHSLYAIHLSKWFETFDRNRILLLSYNELQQNPAKVQERIKQFLPHLEEIPVMGNLKYSNSNDNPYKVQSPSVEAKKMLLEVLEPHNEELYKLLESYPGPSVEQRPFPRFL